MSLRGSSKDNKMKVLESRYGKIITVCRKKKIVKKRDSKPKRQMTVGGKK